MVFIIFLITLFIYIISQVDDGIKKQIATEHIKENARFHKDLAYWDAASHSYRMFANKKKVKRFIYNDINGFRYSLFVYDELFDKKIAGMQYADRNKSIEEKVIPKKEDIAWWIAHDWY